jgi:hypothetical protein
VARSCASDSRRIVADVVVVRLEQGPDGERGVIAEQRDELARLLRVGHGFGGLSAQPGHDRDAVVAVDHHRVVRVPHDAGELELEDEVELLDDGLRVEGFAGHGEEVLSE